MKKSRILAIILVLCMALALFVGCGGGDDATTDNPANNGGGTGAGAGAGAGAGSNAGSGNVLAPGDVIAPPEDENVRFADTLELQWDITPNIIDPHDPGDSGSGALMMFRLMFDRLISRTLDGAFHPELATSWETADLRTFTFNLREDVVFHNGDKFTAQDVVDTVRSAQDSPGTLGYDSWRDVVEASVVSEYTVRIVLNEPTADFLYLLSLPGASIINYGARQSDPARGAWVGTGAYFLSDQVIGDYVSFTRNDNYWGEPPLTRQLNLRYIPEVTARTIMMVNGETHWSQSIGTEDLQMFVDDPDFTVYAYPSNAENSIIFGMLDSITGDLNFRLAVAHALNRDEIAPVAVGDWFLPVTTGTAWGYAQEFKNTDIPVLQFDLDLARQYLAASSYNGEEIEIMSSIVRHHRAAEMLQEQLTRIGIRTSLFQTDMITLQSLSLYGSDAVQILVHTVPFNNSASSARSILGVNGYANRGTYNNPTVNELFDRAPLIVDPAEREASYKHIQELVNEDLPIINLYHFTRTIVTPASVGGVVTDPDQCHDLRYMFMVLDD